MPRSRLGLNINAEKPNSADNRQKAVDDAINMQALYHLILDDYVGDKWFFTRQLLARAKDTTPIHRRYWYKVPGDASQGGWDGSLHRSGADEWAIVSTLMRHQDTAKLRVMEQLYNEPELRGAELRTKNALIAKCIRKGAPYDMFFCVDNAQERHIHLEDVENGDYDELLYTVDEFPKNVIGVHKYGLGTLMGNISNAAIAKLATPGAFPHKSWEVGTPEGRAKQRAAYIANWQESHLCSGSVALVNRAKSLGLKPPKIVATEAWWDFVRLDKDKRDDGLMSVAVKGLNGGVEPRGYPTLDTYWRNMFTAENWTKEQAAFEQLKWLDAVEIPEVVGICGYTLDTSFMEGTYHLGNS